MRLNGYRLMWLLVMFDLPTGTSHERKAASAFRNDLLDFGFEMVQFSVYAKFCGGEQRRKSILDNVQRAVPSDGKVDILTFTDKQYEAILRFENRKVSNIEATPKQFLLI